VPCAASLCPIFPGCTEKKPYHALKENEKTKAREKRRLATLARAGHRHQVRKAPSQLTLNSEQGVRAAFYVSWDAASFSSLREYARQIDLLFPTWLQVLSADGHLQASDPETNAMFDVIQGQTVRPVDDKVMQFLKAEDTDMEVFPVVQNFDGTDFVPGISDFSEQSGSARQFSTRDRDFSRLRSLSRFDDRFRILSRRKGSPDTWLC
jgi:peptidoglycan-N-acetylglucosamine deacetylase